MSSRKLGRGLDSLLQRTKARSPKTSDTALDDGESVVQIRVQDIEPNPFQPRRSYDRKEMDSLKASISREGVLQPVLVRRTADGAHYQLVAGERRLRACTDLDLQTVPAIVIKVGDDKLLELALIENIHREDLNPIDTANAFQKLLELRGWTQEVLATNLGLGRPTVSNFLRLLELPERIQKALGRGQIQIGHAKVLLSIGDSVAQQKLFETIAEDRLSVRDLEVARDGLSGPPRAGSRSSGRRRSSKSKPANVVELEEQLSEALGTRVTIHEKNGRGTLKISFFNPDDFESLRRTLLAAAKKA